MGAPKITAALQGINGLADVSSDQQNQGLESDLNIDRASAARGSASLSPQQIDDALYDAFGCASAQVSTMYTPLNQYHVVMEADSRFNRDPGALDHLYVRPPGGQPIPLSAFATRETGSAPLSVNHQSQFPAITVSFNLRPGVALGLAVDGIREAPERLGVPATIHGKFAGTAAGLPGLAGERAHPDRDGDTTARGDLHRAWGFPKYREAWIHPITILSTLPSAGVGALLALLVTGTDLSVIALIGIILLIGIVKKNAIMMIDFALDAERHGGKSPDEAIYQACLLRFRPITMTTMAALLGGLPLAIGLGVGSELRKPLGIAVVGGLIFQPGADAVYAAGRLSAPGPAEAQGAGQAARLVARRAKGVAGMKTQVLLASLGVLAFTATSCKVGPDYKAGRDGSATGVQEVRPIASPRPSRSKPDWWKLFGDEELSGSGKSRAAGIKTPTCVPR